MNTQTKAIITAFIISGLLHAGVWAASDYSDGQNFRGWRFVFNFLFFGAVMALIARYSFKNRPKGRKAQ